MPQALVKMIDCNSRLKPGERFIELPEVSFNGREILVRVLPTDDPANVAVVCMKQIKELMTRDTVASITKAGIDRAIKNSKKSKPN